MDKFKLFFSTFILVFLAELGDKTQIASFSMAAGNGDYLSVLIGASLALITSTFLAVIFGQLIARYVNKNILKIISSILFILTGLYLGFKLIYNSGIFMKLYQIIFVQ